MFRGFFSKVVKAQVKSRAIFQSKKFSSTSDADASLLAQPAMLNQFDSSLRQREKRDLKYFMEKAPGLVRAMHQVETAHNGTSTHQSQYYNRLNWCLADHKIEDYWSGFSLYNYDQHIAHACFNDVIKYIETGVMPDFPKHGINDRFDFYKMCVQHLIAINSGYLMQLFMKNKPFIGNEYIYAFTEHKWQAARVLIDNISLITNVYVSNENLTGYLSPLTAILLSNKKISGEGLRMLTLLNEATCKTPDAVIMLGQERLELSVDELFSLVRTKYSNYQQVLHKELIDVPALIKSAYKMRKESFNHG